METEDLETLFLTFLYNLKGHCEDSIFTVRRTLDEKNIEILHLIHADSFDTNNKAVQLKIQEALTLQTKIYLSDTLLNITKQLILNYEHLNSKEQDFTAHLETILWILQKLATTHFMEQFKNIINKSYGQSVLGQMEKFRNIDVDTLEKESHSVNELYYIEEYIRNVEDLYLPWFDQKPLNLVQTGPKTKQKYSSFKVNKNMFLADYTNANWNTPITPIKPKIILPKIEARSTPKGIKSPTSRLSLQGDAVPRFKSKPHFPQAPTLVSIMLPQEEACLIKSSVNFDFNQLSSNLKISIIKGLSRTNIELYDQIEPALRKKGDLFVDESFKPELGSLASNLAEFPIAGKIVWKRLREIYQEKTLKVCSDDIGPNDIQQGELGDCYLLSALSVLAEQKGFIKRLFHSKGPSLTGCYSIWLCDSGEWKNIIVDDYIPCTEYDDVFEPCFSKSKSDDVWVVLLEKAFAKLFGNYHTIDEGNLSEAMTALTGAPTKYFKEKKNGIPLTDQLWMFIIESLKSKFPVTAASRGESRLGQHRNFSIVSNHAYAVLDVKEVAVSATDLSNFMENASIFSEADKQSVIGHETPAQEKLIKMRNPWGIGIVNTEEWHKRSQYWSSRVRLEENESTESLESNNSSEDEGTFWISLTDFARNFRSVCACEIHNDYYFSFIKLGEHKRNQNYFIAKMELQTSGFVYLTVQQKMKKHFRKNESYKYSCGRVILGQADDKGKVIAVADGKYKGDQNIVLRKKLNKGVYIVLIEMDWVQKFHNEVVLTAYAKTKITFQEEPMNKYDLFTLYEGFLKSLLNSPNGKKFVKSKQYENGNNKCQMWKHKIEKFGLVGLYYSNEEKDIALNVRLEMLKLNNMELYPMTTRERPVLELRLEPGSERMVILKAKVQKIEPEKEIEMNAITPDSFAYEYDEKIRLSHVYTKDQLKLVCREKGNKNIFLDGAIEVYSYKYLGGLAEYYVNNGEQGTFRHEIIFESENILVNGKDPRNMAILVPPKQDYLLDFKIKDLYRSSKFARKTKALLV